MKLLLKTTLIALFICLINTSANAQTPIPVCPQTSSFSSMVRGYYFTAPANFTICGIYVEDDMSTAFQSAAIVRFTAGPPPAYAATTNAFVTLWQNLNYVPNNMIPVPNVTINAGDIIGIYGARSAGTINSYGPGNCVITIQGIPTTTYRSGMQFSLAAGPGMYDIWNENSGSIGRVTMYTSCCPAPLPIAAVSGPTTVCEGDVVTYTVPAQTGATAYNWTVPAGATITGGQNTTSLNVTWNTAPGGNVCVDWTDACATSTPTCLAVTVNAPTVPTFTPVAAICSGDPLVPLPTTSTNAITGTWSPAMNNTTTTTYTFTPTAGTCATTTTMTITVNPNITPTFTQIAAICNGDPLAPLPTTSTNAITGAWSPAVNNTATTTYTFTPTAGLCATTTTMTITVGAPVTPSFTQVAPICSGDPLGPLPTTSTNAVTGTWSPAVNNTATTTYTFTPTAGACATTTTMTITVGPPATPTFTQVAAICNGDLLSPLPTTSTNAVTGTWSPAVNNTATTTYTFTPTAGACATTTTMTVTVNPQTIPTFTQVAAICSGDPLAPLPTTSTNTITGTWSPAVNNTATTTYTFTPTAGSCATTTTMTITVNPPTIPAFTQIATICSGDPLAPLPTTSTNGVTGTWSPAVNNTATTTYTFTPTVGLCATTTSMTITINPIVSGSTNISICQGDSILIGGVFVSTAGSYTETLTSSLGCDSVLTTNLSINPITTANLSFTVCQGDSVFIESIYHYTDTIFPYTYTSAIGCDSIIIYEVIFTPPPSFSITGGGAFINLGQSVDLAVMPGVAGTTYSWNPPIGLSCLFCQNPTATPTESMWYYVTVTNANGCSIIDSVYIDVDPSSNIYVPNIFSPNKDGNNDVYFVQGKGIQQFDLAIYNRWGQKVFESDDITIGWDGTKGGTMLNQGVFVYNLKVRFHTGKTFEQTGNITLVR